MSFKDIRGQDNAVGSLKDALRNGRIAHAYIFFGPSGVGKKLAAFNFAKAMNCRGESPEKPCDACASCRKIDTLNHPDIYLVKPKKEFAPIGIDDIRAIIKDAYLKAYEAKKKVYIIDDAHLMTEESSNAVLKTLEEPPSDSVLILVTDRMSRLFSTIISRAQALKFLPIKTEEIKEVLMKLERIDKIKAHILASVAGGSLGDALKYKGEELFEKREAIIRCLSEGTFFDLDFDKTPKNELKLYLDIMLAWYRDILVASSGAADAVNFINIDKEPLILKGARRSRPGKIEDIIKGIIDTGSYLDRNANPKVAMNALGLKIVSLERSDLSRSRDEIYT